MAFQQLAGCAPRIRNGDHALGPREYAVHVHHLRDANDLRPGEHLAHLRAAKARSRNLKRWSRGHRRRRLQQAAQRKIAARIDRITHTGDAEHIGKLVRIPEHRGRALRNHRRRIMMWQHVRAFKMNMRVNQAGSQKAALKLVHFHRIAPGARRVNACDHRTDNPHIRHAEFAGDYIDYLPARQQQVERRVPLRGLDGAGANGGFDVCIRGSHGRGQGCTQLTAFARSASCPGFNTTEETGTIQNSTVAYWYIHGRSTKENRYGPVSACCPGQQYCRGRSIPPAARARADPRSRRLRRPHLRLLATRLHPWARASRRTYHFLYHVLCAGRASAGALGRRNGSWRADHRDRCHRGHLLGHHGPANQLSTRHGAWHGRQCVCRRAGLPGNAHPLAGRAGHGLLYRHPLPRHLLDWHPAEDHRGLPGTI